MFVVKGREGKERGRRGQGGRKEGRRERAGRAEGGRGQRGRNEEEDSEVGRWRRNRGNCRIRLEETGKERKRRGKGTRV